MKTIALRFAENFAPECGTIAAHNQVIEERGSVWYGKLGSPVSTGVVSRIMEADDPVILLIHSGRQERYWAHVRSISREVPDVSLIPTYYRGNAPKFGCWFEVTRFERAANDVMSRCVVASSKKPLTAASRYSMSPYFIIDYEEDGDVQ